MEHARRSTASDLDALTVLWNQAVAELDGQRGGFLLAGSLVRPGPRQSIAAYLEDPERIIVAGLIDDVAVGLASVVCEGDRREPVAHLELIYVEPEARQVGVAEAMVKVVIEWAAGQGCVGVDAPALPGNRAAKAFFETHGFLARLLVMHIPVLTPLGRGEQGP